MPSYLTRSEIQIIKCIAEDSCTVRETAEALCVIYQCVANHLQDIYDKLGIKRNLQALTKWYYADGGCRAIAATRSGNGELTMNTSHSTLQ